jgi:hypothetical protein
MKKIPLLICFSATLLMLMTVSSIAVYKRMYGQTVAYYEDCNGFCVSITAFKVAFQALQPGDTQASITDRFGFTVPLYLDNQCSQAAEFSDC